MPVDKKMMSSMQKEYGSKKGKSVYFALENKRRMMAGKVMVGKKGKAKAKK